MPLIPESTECCRDKCFRKHWLRSIEWPAQRLSAIPVLLLLAGLVMTQSGCTSLAGMAGDPDDFNGYRQTRLDGPGANSLVAKGSAEPVANLPRSRLGNPPEYTVKGKRYAVMQTARGYSERGHASWYGSRFHGRKTSSGQVYNMYNLTAAHRHLPLPTFVRVTRLDNGRSIVVKVNDRGPFHSDRIIDLSYAAAVKLGFADSGTAEVEVVAVSMSAAEARAAGGGSMSPGDGATKALSATGTLVQLGAFRELTNAQELRSRVDSVLGTDAAWIDSGGMQAGEGLRPDDVHRVQLGPLAANAPLQQILATLADAGIQQYSLHSQ